MTLTLYFACGLRQGASPVASSTSLVILQSTIGTAAATFLPLGSTLLPLVGAPCS